MGTWGRHGGAPAPRPKKGSTTRGGIKKHTQDWARSVEAAKGLTEAHADFWELLRGGHAAVDAPDWVIDAAEESNPQFEKALRGRISAVEHEDKVSDDDNLGGPDVNISDVEEYSASDISDHRDVSDAGDRSDGVLSHSSDSEPPQKRSRTGEAVEQRAWDVGPERPSPRDTAEETSTREYQEEWPLPSQNNPLRKLGQNDPMRKSSQDNPLRKLGRMRAKSSARWQTVR